MIDVAIIGGGPAGLNAALYAGRAGLDAVLFEKMFAGGQMVTTTQLDNYIGFPGGVGAVDLAMNMEEQAKSAGAKIQYEEILNLDLSGTVKKIKTGKQEYDAKAVILCMGATPRALGVDGEERLRGRGVSYCATCDGAFFKGKAVAVVGGGDTALEDALFLSRYCDKVYLIHRRNAFRGTKIVSDKVGQMKNVDVIWDTVVERINGQDKVESIDVKNVQNEEPRTITLDGVFIAVGTQPNNALVQGKVALDEQGYVLAGEDMKTNVKGVFAAGDLRQKLLRQIITAASDGAVAVYSAARYIDTEFVDREE